MPLGADERETNVQLVGDDDSSVRALCLDPPPSERYKITAVMGQDNPRMGSSELEAPFVAEFDSDLAKLMTRHGVKAANTQLCGHIRVDVLIGVEGARFTRHRASSSSARTARWLAMSSAMMLGCSVE